MSLKMPILAESDIVRSVSDFMEHHGWRAVRNQRTVVPGHFATGEPGMADHLFVRYHPTKRFPAMTMALWIEFKKPNARQQRCRCAEIAGTRKRCTPCDQRNWKERERARGGLVWTVDDVQWFIDTYDSMFGWLHSGDLASGQLDLLAGVGSV